ncbi:MAG: D-aminoacylase [Chloroflexi bacterium]|nr:D-aminoacylase [Chloroflexota bacterium]
MLDILIRGGQIVDGTGRPRFRADVAIRGDTIVEVGSLPSAAARLVVDADGKIVCPGFVDAHTHSDLSIFGNPLAVSTIRQGVTTEVVGNCGMSLAPTTALSSTATASTLARYAPDVPVTWTTFGSYLDALEALGTSINLVPLVGHNQIRLGVVGSVERPATTDEVAAMRAHVREAMAAGAFGLSTGLEYPPARNVPTDELVALCAVVAEHGGVHASHIRNRDRFLVESMAEVLAVSEQTGVSLQVSHLDAKPGVSEGAWHEAVAMLESAQRQGVDVHADMANYETFNGQMAAILPPWLTAEGTDRAIAYLRDRQVRERLRTECDRYWLLMARGQFDRIRLAQCHNSRQHVGMTIAEIAGAKRCDPWDAYFDVLADEGPDFGQVSVLADLFTHEHLQDQMRHPAFILASDGISTATTAPGGELELMPIPYAAMTRYLTTFCRAERLLSLEETIRKMTSYPAKRFGIGDRGVLAAGKKADVVVFDEAGLTEVATYAAPRQYARGYEAVLVNGRPTVLKDTHTEERAGRVLRK